MLAMKVQMTALRLWQTNLYYFGYAFFANFCTSFSLDSWIQILVQKFAVGYKINRYVVCLCVCFLFKSSFSYIMQNIKFDGKVIYLLATYLLDNFYSHGLYYAVLL